MKTITDVAKAANVSVATVSKVFNGYKDVGADTKEKVMRLAEELDYFPNRNASQLVNRKEDTICVILSSLGYKNSEDEYLVGLLSGIYSEANKNHLRVVIFTPDAILNNNQNYVQFCRSNNLIGFIVHGLDEEAPQMSHLVESEVPCVFIDNHVVGKRTATVSVNNEQACMDVIDKLVGLGHREIAFVTGSETADISGDRLRGYQRGIEKNGLKVRLVKGEFIYEEAYQNVHRHIIDFPETTAFFCASDIMAAGAVNACLDLNYQIPADISIVGFDNLSFASYLRPKLSTVVQNFHEMGAVSASILMEIFAGGRVKTQNFVDYQIKMRQSTAKNIRG